MSTWNVSGETQLQKPVVAALPLLSVLPVIVVACFYVVVVVVVDVVVVHAALSLVPGHEEFNQCQWRACLEGGNSFVPHLFRPKSDLNSSLPFNKSAGLPKSNMVISADIYFFHAKQI